MHTIHDATVAVLNDLEFNFWRDDADDTLTVPFSGINPLDTGPVLVHIVPYEEKNAVLIVSNICQVQEKRRADVALLLGRLNTHYFGITFAIDSEGIVAIEVVATFCAVTDPEHVIAGRFRHLFKAVKATIEEIYETAGIIAVQPKQLWMKS